MAFLSDRMIEYSLDFFSFFFAASFVTKSPRLVKVICLFSLQDDSMTNWCVSFAKFLLTASFVRFDSVFSTDKKKMTHSLVLPWHRQAPFVFPRNSLSVRAPKQASSLLVTSLDEAAVLTLTNMNVRPWLVQ